MAKKRPLKIKHTHIVHISDKSNRKILAEIKKIIDKKDKKIKKIDKKQSKTDKKLKELAEKHKKDIKELKAYTKQAISSLDTDFGKYNSVNNALAGHVQEQISLFKKEQQTLWSLIHKIEKELNRELASLKKEVKRYETKNNEIEYAQNAKIQKNSSRIERLFN